MIWIIQNESYLYFIQEIVFLLFKSKHSKNGKEKNQTVKYQAFVKDGNDKMVTKDIPHTWLKQYIVPKYWKHAEQFFNH